MENLVQDFKHAFCWSRCFSAWQQHLRATFRRGAQREWIQLLPCIMSEAGVLRRFSLPAARDYTRLRLDPVLYPR